MISKPSIVKKTNTHNLQHIKHQEISINCAEMSHFINIDVGYKGKIRKHALGLAQGNLTMPM